MDQPNTEFHFDCPCSECLTGKYTYVKTTDPNLAKLLQAISRPNLDHLQYDNLAGMIEALAAHNRLLFDEHFEALSNHFTYKLNFQKAMAEAAKA